MEGALNISKGGMLDEISNEKDQNDKIQFIVGEPQWALANIVTEENNNGLINSESVQLHSEMSVQTMYNGVNVCLPVHSSVRSVQCLQGQERYHQFTDGHITGMASFL